MTALPPPLPKATNSPGTSFITPALPTASSTSPRTAPPVAAADPRTNPQSRDILRPRSLFATPTQRPTRASLPPATTDMSAVDCMMPSFTMAGSLGSHGLMLEDSMLPYGNFNEAPSIESLGLALDDKPADLINDLPLNFGFQSPPMPTGTVSPQLLSNKSTAPSSSQSRKRKASETPSIPEAKRPAIAQPSAQRPQVPSPAPHPIQRHRNISSASPSLGASMAQQSAPLFSASPFPSQSPFQGSVSPFTGGSIYDSTYGLDGAFGTSAPMLSSSTMTLSPNLISTPPVTQSMDFGHAPFSQPMARPSSYSGPAPSYSFPFSPRQQSDTPAPMFLTPSFEGGASSEAPRPKPQCWDHGCNGRQFSTFSNLLRHQRERAGTAAKSSCPRCSAKFTRTTAMKGHLASGKCRPRRNSDVQ